MILKRKTAEVIVAAEVDIEETFLAWNIQIFDIWRAVIVDRGGQHPIHLYKFDISSLLNPHYLQVSNP